MTDLTRRDALAATAFAALVTALPAWAQDRSAPVDAAQWDLSEIYPDDAAWDAARKSVLAKIPGLASYRGKLGTGAEVLAAALVAQSDLSREAARVYTYAGLKIDADLRIFANQEKLALVGDMFTAFGEATSWMAPELLMLGKAKIDGFIAANRTLATRFDLYLADTLRQAPHTL
ncbi:MAG: oligoendopeptidase F, partial [Sphingomonas sp.]